MSDSDRLIEKKKAYKEAIIVCLFSQLFIALFCMMAFDGGRLIQYFGVAILAFWPANLLLLIRTKNKPNAKELLFIKYSFVPIMILAVVALNYAWKVRAILH